MFDIVLRDPKVTSDFDIKLTDEIIRRIFIVS
jgi:hypothetical protein